MLKEIEEYIKKSHRESHIILKIIQANLWLKVYSKSFDCLVLSLFLFFDDLGTDNPLGSHAGTNKFGALYASIACLPPHIGSRLSSIFFTTLVHTEDKKQATNERVFRQIVKELNFLQREGV